MDLSKVNLVETGCPLGTQIKAASETAGPGNRLSAADLQEMTEYFARQVLDATRQDGFYEKSLEDPTYRWVKKLEHWMDGCQREAHGITAFRIHEALKSINFSNMTEEQKDLAREICEGGAYKFGVDGYLHPISQSEYNKTRLVAVVEKGRYLNISF